MRGIRVRSKTRRRSLLAALIATLVVGLFAAPAGAQEDPPVELPPGGTFLDDDGSTHEGNIEAIYAAGITLGCTEDGEYFCPEDPVLRKYMAAFLHRALDLPSGKKDYFTDDDGLFEKDINAIAKAGITLGCTPTEFCPDVPIARDQMAALIVRAMGWKGEPKQAFNDTRSNYFRNEINILAREGVTNGCTETLYCPSAEVERQEMASFLARALGLEPIVPPPRPEPTLIGQFTTFHPCCESRVTNIHLMSDTIDGMVVAPGQTFSINATVGERTSGKGYVPAPAIIGGEVYCCDHPANIGGGVSQVATTLYNAVFFAGLEDVFHQPHSLYISRYPMGREATLGWTAPDLVFRNDTSTPVTIDMSYSDSSLTATLYGDNEGRQVDDGLTGTATPEGGGTVTVYRYITYLDGETITQSWTWTYQAPANGLVLPF